MFKRALKNVFVVTALASDRKSLWATQQSAILARLKINEPIDLTSHKLVGLETRRSNEALEL